MFLLRVTVLVVLVSGLVFASPEEPKKTVPKFKIGKDTTFVDGPLDAEGYIDYEAALNTLLKGSITPENNAVVLLLKCLGPKPEGSKLHPDFYKALGVEPPQEKGDYLVTYRQHFKNELAGAEQQKYRDLQDRLTFKPWKSVESAEHVQWLKINEKPLSVAVEASQYAEYYHPSISRKKDGKPGPILEASMPMVQEYRELAELLVTRTMLKLGEGQIDEAFSDVLAIHRLGRLVSRGGSGLDFLVGIALQARAHNAETAIFEQGQPTAKQLLAYQAELLKLPRMAKFADIVNWYDRFVYLDSHQATRREGLDGRTPDQVAQALDFELIFRYGNTIFDKIVAFLKLPTRSERLGMKEIGSEIENGFSTRNRKKARKQLQGDTKKVRAAVSEEIGKVHIGLLCSGIEKLADATDRNEQIHRNGIVAAGLAAHFADTGKYPESLVDLLPKYLAKVPSDVFNEKPLTYRKLNTGYLFYSVGSNGVDDGGKLVTDVPRGDDVGVRMPWK